MLYAHFTMSVTQSLCCHVEMEENEWMEQIPPEVLDQLRWLLNGTAIRDWNEEQPWPLIFQGSLPRHDKSVFMTAALQIELLFASCRRTKIQSLNIRNAWASPRNETPDCSQRCAITTPLTLTPKEQYLWWSILSMLLTGWNSCLVIHIARRLTNNEENKNSI